MSNWDQALDHFNRAAVKLDAFERAQRNTRWQAARDAAVSPDAMIEEAARLLEDALNLATTNDACLRIAYRCKALKYRLEHLEDAALAKSEAVCE